MGKCRVDANELGTTLPTLAVGYATGCNRPYYPEIIVIHRVVIVGQQ